MKKKKYMSLLLVISIVSCSLLAAFERNAIAMSSPISTNLVLKVDAMNIDGAGNFADPTDTNTSWTDLSSSGNNGQLTNFTLPASSISGWSGANLTCNPSHLIFDGINDFVNLNKTASLNLPGSTTAAIWMKITDPSMFSYILSDFDSTGNISQGSIRVGSTGSKLGFYQKHTDGSSLAYDGTTLLTANTWYNIAYVRDNTAKTVQLYLNGVAYGLPQSYTGKTVVSDTTAGNKTLGRAGNYNGDYTCGEIANVRIYNVALTPSEINQNYLAETNDYQTPTPACGSSTSSSSSGGSTTSSSSSSGSTSTTSSSGSTSSTSSSGSTSTTSSSGSTSSTSSSGSTSSTSSSGSTSSTSSSGSISLNRNFTGIWKAVVPRCVENRKVAERSTLFTMAQVTSSSSGGSELPAEFCVSEDESRVITLKLCVTNGSISGSIHQGGAIKKAHIVSQTPVSNDETTIVIEDNDGARSTLTLKLLTGRKLMATFQDDDSNFTARKLNSSRSCFIRTAERK